MGQKSSVCCSCDCGLAEDLSVVWAPPTVAVAAAVAEVTAVGDLPSVWAPPTVAVTVARATVTAAEGAAVVLGATARVAGEVVVGTGAAVVAAVAAVVAEEAVGEVLEKSIVCLSERCQSGICRWSERIVTAVERDGTSGLARARP